jgi:PH domain
LELTVDALKELKVNTFGKRFKMMNAINYLKQQNIVQTRTSQDFDEEEDILAREEERLELGDEEEDMLRDTRPPPSNVDANRSNPPSQKQDYSNSVSSDRKDTRSPTAGNMEEDDVVSNYNSVVPSRPLTHSQSVHQMDRSASPSLSRSRTAAAVPNSPTQNMPGQDANPRQQRNVVYSPRLGNAQPSLANVWDSENQQESSSKGDTFKPRSPPTAAALASSPPANGVRRQGSIMTNNKSNITTPPVTNNGNYSHPFRPEHQPFEKRGSLMPQPKPQGILPVATRYSVDSQRGMNDMTPDMEGWLHKQGDKYKTWNKRWFVLKGANLFYFKSPRDIRMKGIINLRGYRVISDDSIYAGKWCFKTQHERERTFFFYCDTEEGMREWIKALMKATILRDYNGKQFVGSFFKTAGREPLCQLAI